MANKFSSGKNSIAECDRCGFRYKLSQLKPLTIKTKITNIMVCPTCFEKDHPQLQLGMYPVEDPQAVRNPRPDSPGYFEDTSGGGSRQTQWGWAPVGGASGTDSLLTPNDLVGITLTGTVIVSVT